MQSVGAERASENPDEPITLAVIYGGRSGEHPISCATAGGVLAALDSERYRVIPIGITPDGAWVPGTCDPDELQLAGASARVEDSGERMFFVGGSGDVHLRQLHADGTVDDLGTVDVVFPLLHGSFGEDGTIQGLLEMAGVRYVGSGVLASAVAMDKQYMKIALQAAGLPVGPYFAFSAHSYDDDPAPFIAAARELTAPLFVKPARAGSSLGISRIDDVSELDAAVAEARRYDPKIVVEQGLTGREIECAVLAGRAGGPPRTSHPGEIELADASLEFYDFETKYVDTAPLKLRVPADLPAAVEARVRELAAQAFTALSCEGLARVDFFVDGEEVIINEANTMPGFTPFSMYPLMWERSGLSYGELLDELIGLALERPAGLR